MLEGWISLMTTKSLIDYIRLRRSVRDFSDRPIDEKTIEELLISAMHAPSPKNKQPWSFVVCSGTTKQKISHVLDKVIHEKLDTNKEQTYLLMAKETAALIKQAPVFVLVCYDKNDMGYENDGELWNIKSPQCECSDIQSIGACIQNLLLSAYNLGISSLWICDILYAYDEIKKIINSDGTILAGVLLGYSESKQPPIPPRDFDKIKWLK